MSIADCGRVSRRAAIGLLGASALTGAASGRTLPAAPAVGLQLFTVLKEMLEAPLATLQAIAAMGFQEVELLIGLGGTGPEAAALLRTAGLGCRSVLAMPYAMFPGVPNLEDNPDQVLDTARALGVRFLVCGSPLVPARLRPTPEQGDAGFWSAINRMEPADWTAHVEFLHRIGRRARLGGLRLLYHNHSPEFRPLGRGTVYDRLVTETDPALVNMELDCGWAAAAGQDPAALIRRLGKRVSLLHLKDVASGQAPSVTHPLRTTELGRGSVDFAAVIAAARQAGLEAMFVEQEPPYVRPALESARISLEFLKGVKA